MTRKIDLAQCAPTTLLSAYFQYVCAEDLRRLFPFHMNSKNVAMLEAVLANISIIGLYWFSPSYGHEAGGDEAVL